MISTTISSPSGHLDGKMGIICFPTDDFFRFFCKLNLFPYFCKSKLTDISRYLWDMAVIRIGQLTSKMRLSIGGQSVGGSNGNADELTNWNGTKKRGLGI